MDKIILAVALVLISMLVITILIICLTIKKALKKWQKDAQYLIDQKDVVKLCQIERLTEAKRYYNAEYHYVVTFQKIQTLQNISLYVLEITSDMVLNQEYQIIHDGVVLFEIEKL